MHETGTYDELVSQPQSEMCALVKMYASETADSRTSVGPVHEATADDAAGDAKEAAAVQRSDDHATNDLTGQEASNEGRVKLAVYFAYTKAATVLAMVAVAFLFLTNPLTQAATTFWLALWADDAYQETQWFYLGWYV